MKIKDIIPPFIVRLLQSAILFKVHCKGDFTSYDAALKKCEGYEESALVDVIFKKTVIAKEKLNSEGKFEVDSNTAQIMMGLCLSARVNQINVIDLGGAFGYHYLIAKSLLKEKYKLKWCVVETPAIVARAKPFESPELMFASSLEESFVKLGEVDVVFSSSTLQYIPSSYKILEEIIALKVNHLLMVRIPLIESGQEKIAIQYSKYSCNGPGHLPKGMNDGVAKYPIQFLSKKKIEEILSTTYNIKLFTDKDSASLTYRGKTIKTYGYFATLKK